MTSDPSNEPAPPLRAYVERGGIRLFLEGIVGAVGGGMLAILLPHHADDLALFITVGAVAAPVALLLTPVYGSLRYRALRYGVSLAVLVTLTASFVAGADGLLVEELLALGVIVFALGALAHAVLSSLIGDRGEHDDDEPWRGVPPGGRDARG